MHNRIISFGTSYVNKAPLKRKRHVRPLKVKLKQVVLENEKEGTFLTWDIVISIFILFFSYLVSLQSI